MSPHQQVKNIDKTTILLTNVNGQDELKMTADRCQAIIFRLANYLIIRGLAKAEKVYTNGGYTCTRIGGIRVHV